MLLKFLFVSPIRRSLAILCLAGILSLSASMVGQEKGGEEKSGEEKSGQEKSGQVTGGQEGNQEKQAGQGADSDGNNKDQSDQETNSPQGEDHPVTQLMSKWRTLRTQLVDAQREFNESFEQAKIDASRKKYMELYDQGIEIIAQIKTTALARVKADVNDKASWNALTGILIHYASNDETDRECFELAEQMIAANVSNKYFQAAREVPRLSLFNKSLFDEIIVRRSEQDDNLPRVKIKTEQGDLTLELFENEAPETVGNFISLIESDFYDGSNFHRVIDGFMAQGGKAAEGKKDVDYTIYSEFGKPSSREHFTGSLSMANAGPNTGSSEFFITFKRTSELNRRHTVFGRVVEGFDVLPKITRNVKLDQFGQETPIEGAKPVKILDIEILRKKNHEYKPNKVSADGGGTGDQGKGDKGKGETGKGEKGGQPGE